MAKPKIEDLMKKTHQEGSNGYNYLEKSIPIQELIIPSAKSNELKLDPNFKTYLTFFIHTGFPKEETEYVRQISAPFNGDKKLIPITYSLDLTGLLKRTIKSDYLPLKNGPANFKLIRAEVGKYAGTGIGIYNLYDDFAKDISDRTRLDEIVNKNIKDISNEGGQFEIAVPQDKRDIIRIIDTSKKTNSAPFPVVRFSDKYSNGVKATIVKNGEKIDITKEDLIKPDDKVVIGFGGFIGDPYIEKDGKPRINPKRTVLMYVTPKELMSRL